MSQLARIWSVHTHSSPAIYLERYKQYMMAAAISKAEMALEETRAKQRLHSRSAAEQHYG